MQKFPILGVPLHLSADYLGWLQQACQDAQGVHVVTLNAEMVMQARQNLELHRVISEAECVVPDGAGVVLYLRLYGKRVKRCPGIELAEKLVCWASSVEKTVFLIGGAEGVSEQVALNWQEIYPRLRVVGKQHGFFLADQAQTQALIQELKVLQPDIILVGLGVPRQELWIARNRHLCPHSIWIGVGGSLDIWSGAKERAPAWLRENNLEWLYRLYKEPWRWRRMLALPKFALISLWYSLRFR
jgi:N-acetylglucosaminyldiphosphoundecaprenol N-acetyl-beta-D-mannosaminyltransferase